MLWMQFITQLILSAFFRKLHPFRAADRSSARRDAPHSRQPFLQKNNEPRWETPAVPV